MNQSILQILSMAAKLGEHFPAMLDPYMVVVGMLRPDSDMAQHARNVAIERSAIELGSWVHDRCRFEEGYQSTKISLALHDVKRDLGLIGFRRSPLTERAKEEILSYGEAIVWPARVRGE